MKTPGLRGVWAAFSVDRH